MREVHSRSASSLAVAATASATMNRASCTVHAPSSPVRLARASRRAARRIRASLTATVTPRGLTSVVDGENEFA